MGRKKVYKTEEERRNAELIWKREWYHRNAGKTNKLKMEKYYAKKTNIK